MDSGSTITHFGKYENLGKLGEGGMAEVYLGIDKNIDREVAIKTLKESTEELRQRFSKEVQAGKLNHQNIVTVYDSGEQDGKPYIVMEFIAGETLEKLIASRKPDTLLEKLDIIRQVSVGLGYAHGKKVYHRDIKPSNVMVQLDGNVKIVDFGIARLANTTNNTQTGNVIGTLHYLAPERLKGQEADGRADIWSAGVMLYQLLTGEVPFPGKEPGPVAQKIVNEPYQPLSKILTGYPPALDQVIERALAKDLHDRYEMAEEMASDLEQITEVLKRERAGEIMTQAKLLIEQEQFTGARGVLLELQRISPQNFEVRKMLREVQDRLSRQQKSEQLQQLMGEAEEAVLTQRYPDAIDLYSQAIKLDPARTGLTEKLDYVRSLKEKADKVSSLLQRAREARLRNAYQDADLLINQALEIHPTNTDLRNERVAIVQEAQRAARENERQRFIRNGRESMASRDVPEAIKAWKTALEIDPTDIIVQRLLQDAEEKQETQRRKRVIDQIVAGIQESLHNEDYAKAFTDTQRALDQLPGETILLQLRTEARDKLHEANTRRLVEETSLYVQSVLLSNPQEALARVQQALDKVPEEPRLIALEERVVEQLKKANIEGLKAQYLKRAQASIDSQQYDQAIHILETTSIDCGEAPDIAYLLGVARSQKIKGQRKEAVSEIIRQAQSLIGSGELEAAIAILAPSAAETGDATVEQLLRQTKGSLAEVARRIDAVVSRVQALSQQDPAQALELLRSQPQAIQQHSSIRELRDRLDTSNERERLTLDAIRSAEKALQQRNFARVLEAMESVQRAYGDNPRLNQAMAEYQRKRARAANEAVTAAIGQARQAILQKEGARAMSELSRTAEALKFADSRVQEDWKRLAEDAAQYSKNVSLNTGTTSIVVQSRGLSLKLVAAIVVAVLVVVGIAIYFLRTPPPAAAGILQINATPFAEVVSVTSEDGKTKVPLPAGPNWTPLRLDGLPNGVYKVIFQSSPQPLTCQVSDAPQVCNLSVVTIGPKEIDEIIDGGKQ